MEKYITDNCALYNGDCLEVMDMLIEKGVKVDAIITDPPYQITSCAWDSVIPFDKMWERLNKLIKDNGAIVLFGSQPFTSELVHSNIKNFKTEWIYQKTCPSNFGTAKYVPMKEHENVLIFGKGSKKINYYPIMEERKGSGGSRAKYKYNIDVQKNVGEVTHIRNYDFLDFKENIDNMRYPSSIQLFNNRAKGDRGLHPTQKPVALIEYLIKTYTNEDELVLDFTMGSGTTCIAARNTNRKVIGIELDEKYFDIAVSRYKGEEIVKESKKEETKEKGLKLASWKKK